MHFSRHLAGTLAYAGDHGDRNAPNQRRRGAVRKARHGGEADDRHGDEQGIKQTVVPDGGKALERR